MLILKVKSLYRHEKGTLCNFKQSYRLPEQTLQNDLGFDFSRRKQSLLNKCTQTNKCSSSLKSSESSRQLQQFHNFIRPTV